MSETSLDTENNSNIIYDATNPFHSERGKLDESLDEHPKIKIPKFLRMKIGGRRMMGAGIDKVVLWTDETALRTYLANNSRLDDSMLLEHLGKF